MDDLEEIPNVIVANQLDITNIEALLIAFGNIFIGLFLGYIGIKGVLEPWK